MFFVRGVFFMKNNNVVKNDKKFNLNRPITGVIQNDRIWEQ